MSALFEFYFKPGSRIKFSKSLKKSIEVEFFREDFKIKLLRSHIDFIVFISKKYPCKCKNILKRVKKICYNYESVYLNFSCSLCKNSCDRCLKCKNKICYGKCKICKKCNMYHCLYCNECYCTRNDKECFICEYNMLYATHPINHECKNSCGK